MFTKEELDTLQNAIRQIRRIIVNKDESESERDIANALVYLDCAVLNIDMELGGRNPVYIVCPTINVSHK